MNNFYRFLRYAMFLAVGMVCMMPAMAQLPFTLTTASDITNGTQNYYLIQSIDRSTFYAIPHSDAESSKVSTTSIPNANMRWYFMDAGSDSNYQYYYIVNSTGRCLYRYNNNHDGIQIKKTYAELSSLSNDELNKYKYYLQLTGSNYYIHPKGETSLYLNKRGGNVPYADDYYFKSSTFSDEPSKWRFVAVNDVTWTQPITVSTNVDKHYYKFQNVTNTSFYLSNSGEWATVSSTDSNENIWYFLEGGVDATYSNCHYYYIVNASTEKYLYYTEGTGNDVAKVMDYDPDKADRFRFLIVDAAYKVNNNYTTGYTIVPKLRQANFSDKDSFAPIAMNDNSHLLLKNDRGSGNYNSHWTLVETEYVGDIVVAPTITNNYDGTISLSTATQGATIYYTTDGTTPDNTSTEYSSAFSLGDATVIKAIAYLDSDYSDVSTYNVPKYTKPTISYDYGTSKVTITSEGTVYYNTGDGSQADPTPSSGTLYSEPFTIDSDITVKAIATHAGYLNSDVATKYIQGNNYSQNYLTFNVLTAGTIVWKAFNETTKTIEYSINGGEWISITSSSSGESFTVDKNDVIRFRGTNSTYATSKSNYSGFEGGTATFDIEGNIHSLLYGDDFLDNNSLTNSTYQFCSLFKKALVISAENLILPATTLKDYCYRALFSWCTTLEKAPVLPATTLATGCYWYMFEKCAITTAPELLSATLVQECYGNMFINCTSLNYIKCLATSGFNASQALNNWTSGVSATGTFVKKESVTWSTGTSGIPTGWLAVDDGTPDIPTISCSGIDIELICGTEGADIYYRLDPNVDYEQYMEAIIMTGDTFIECYSEKEGKTSATISQTCVYDNRTIYEYSNQSLASWTYGGNTITTPYSVNAIDGHSSNYAKGTFNFETDVNLRSQQPTYLWFQHADQSASIYVDNNLVEKHWGGYNAFFVDITDHVHKGTNHIKVALKNNEGNVLAPYAGDFNFNATLGNVKLFTSPCLPSMSYGYDGFHITSTVSSDEATINVKTTIPTGASVVCTITDGDTQVFTDTQDSTGEEMVFTTTITNPHLWNGTLDPHLYNVKLEIYHGNELYHSYERPYGLRFYEYVFDETVNGNPYTGFLLNGQPYLLRGVCVHDDLEGKANALNDADYTQEFNIITDLGCNFLRLAHYPHPKEVYDKCDQLGIIVQTEAPWVNKSTINETEDYWTHLEGQCADMVNQHYNHPCILFWGVGNEINTNYTSTTDGKNFVKSKIESYRNTIRFLMPNAWVGYTVSHGTQDGLGTFNNPTVDWIGQNIYVGWYIDKTSNNPTNRLNTAINNASGHSVPCAFSEYGCGGTRTCHSDDFMSTTTTGNLERHDIEYQMWLHEGHIAAIKNKPELIFTSQWQLFDIAVSNRQEGYKVCFDGETEFDNNELKRLNNKGLVERDHVTKKDPFYLYKAWWNTTDKFVHICGKNYLNTEDRVIKCYTNDGSELTLYVNGASTQTVTVTDNIATFTARSFNDGDVITVSGATTNDTFTIHNYGENVFITKGDWNMASNWSGSAVPDDGSNVVIAAKATVPADYVANAGGISINGGSITIADGGQLYHTNAGVTATVQKDITAYTVLQTQGETKTDGWYLIGYSFAGNGAVDEMDNLLENEYDLFYYDEPTHYWRNYKYDANSFANLETARGYLYANSQDVTIGLKGTLNASNAKVSIPLDYTTTAGSMIGFNLVGNPFAHNVIAYTGNNVAEECYRVNDTRTDLIVDNISNENPLKTGEGFFVKATDENASITFNSGTKDEMKKTERIKLEIREDDQLIDRLIVKREGKPLKKITLNENGTEVFAMHNNQKMAVIPIEGNELPVYFETDKNGTYTISLSTENTTLYYLHLIDNITNDDVDLLTTPSYSFNAWTMDDSDRFKLVFICGEADDDNKTFAFINNGDIIITADVENATLQVIDVMGRMIISRNVNVLGHVPTNGMASGTYILRLISGDNVMTQKIMIR